MARATAATLDHPSPSGAPDGRGPAVRCRGVTKAYPGAGRGAAPVMALRGVDLEVGLGELMMLVGPSGCGKTTLISVIAGILDQTEGECTVFGQDVRSLGARAKALFRGRNVGFVFQQFNLLPSLTAAENVAVPLLILGESRSSAVAKGRVMLERVGLGERHASLPRQLSGGQQQRVAIARSLVHDPRLIVCDEPTSALDHQTGHVVMRMLKNVALEDDRSLIIVTHDQRIFGFADRIARMDDGRIVEVAAAADAEGAHAP